MRSTIIRRSASQNRTKLLSFPELGNREKVDSRRCDMIFHGNVAVMTEVMEDEEWRGQVKKRGPY